MEKQKNVQNKFIFLVLKLNLNNFKLCNCIRKHEDIFLKICNLIFNLKKSVKVDFLLYYMIFPNDFFKLLTIVYYIKGSDFKGQK